MFAARGLPVYWTPSFVKPRRWRNGLDEEPPLPVSPESARLAKR